MKVGHLEERYQEWVHQPIVSKEGPRFFGNDVLEVTYSIILVYRGFWKVNCINRIFESPVLDTHKVVGCANHMAACCLLLLREVYSDGSYHSGSSSDSSVWNIYLDID